MNLTGGRGDSVREASERQGGHRRKGTSATTGTEVGEGEVKTDVGNETWGT